MLVIRDELVLGELRKLTPPEAQTKPIVGIIFIPSHLFVEKFDIFKTIWFIAFNPPPSG